MRQSIFIILVMCLACTSTNFSPTASPVEEISSPYVQQLQLLAEYTLEYVDNPFAFSPDGELIAINHGRSVSIIRLDNLEHISTINPPFGPNIAIPENDEESIRAIAFISNETLVTGSSYYPYGGHRLGSLRLWDIPSRQEIAVLEEEAAVWNLIASPDGRFIAYFRSLEIVLMKLEDRSIVFQTVGSNRFLENYMDFTPDSSQFAIWSGNGVSIINLESQEEISLTVDLLTNGYLGLRLSPDSQSIAIWGQTEIELFDLASLEPISDLSFNYDDDSFIGDIAFQANESHLIVTRSGDTANIEAHDYISGQSLFRIEEHEDTGFSLASHPHYPLFLSGSGDGMVKLWDLSSEAPITLFEFSLNRAVYNVAFCPNGNCLIASSNRQLQIWAME